MEPQRAVQRYPKMEKCDGKEKRKNRVKPERPPLLTAKAPNACLPDPKVPSQKNVYPERFVVIIISTHQYCPVPTPHTHNHCITQAHTHGPLAKPSRLVRVRPAVEI